MSETVIRQYIWYGELPFQTYNDVDRTFNESINSALTISTEEAAMRTPCVADQFYPGSKQLLRQQVESMLPPGLAGAQADAYGVVAPHAGYIYSGPLAGQTLGSVRIPERVVILGPSHRGIRVPLALSNQTWDMVLGQVPIDRELSEALLEDRELFFVDDSTHEFEHCLEVQVPFLQVLQPRLRITPIIVSHVPYDICEAAAQTLAEAIDKCGSRVLIVASSDMNHYESRKDSTKKDALALDAIESFDPRRLYETVHRNRISMCGVIPVVITLLAARRLGATRTELIGYTDSGYVSGDTHQVVGYAGVVIS